jgi:hypothetical protein
VIDRHNMTINFFKYGLCSVYLGFKSEFLRKLQALYLPYISFRLTKIVFFLKIKTNFNVKFDIVNKESNVVEFLDDGDRSFVFFPTNYLLCLLG